MPQADVGKYIVGDIPCVGLTERRMRNASITYDSHLCLRCGTSIFPNWLERVFCWEFGPCIAVPGSDAGTKPPAKRRKATTTGHVPVQLNAPPATLNINGETVNVDSRWNMDEAEMFRNEIIYDSEEEILI